MYHAAGGSKRTRRLRRVWTDWFDRHRHRLAGTVRRPHAWLCPCKRSLPSAYEPTRRIRPPTTNALYHQIGDEDDERDRARLKSALGGSVRFIDRTALSVRDAESCVRHERLDQRLFFNFRYSIGIDCVLNSTLYIICELSYMYKIVFPIFYVNLLSKLCKTHSFAWKSFYQFHFIS